MLQDTLDRKCAFKFERERLGLSQSDIARLLECSVVNISKCEMPSATKNSPTDIAWDLINNLSDNFNKFVDDEVSFIESAGFEPYEDNFVCTKGSTVFVKYFPTEQSFKDSHNDLELPYTYYNAVARAICDKLKDRGYSVVVVSG